MNWTPPITIKTKAITPMQAMTKLTRAGIKVVAKYWVSLASGGAAKLVVESSGMIEGMTTSAATAS